MRYEETALATEGRSVDWYFQPSVGRPILMDVKSRKRAPFSSFKRLLVEQSTAPPEPDCDSLFAGLAGKFESRSSDNLLQGAWIHERIKQDRDAPHQAFASLDASGVHFALFADWGDDAYALARRESDKQLVLDSFQLGESRTFTIDGMVNALA